MLLRINNEKYLIYFNNNEAKAFPKYEISVQTKKDIKKHGFRKYHIEVESENESDALLKIKDFNNSYLDSIKGISGSAVIYAISVITIALIFLFRS